MMTSAITAQQVERYLVQQRNGGYLHPTHRRTSQELPAGSLHRNNGSFAVMVHKSFMPLVFQGSAVAEDGTVDSAAVIEAAAQGSLAGVFEQNELCSEAVVAFVNDELQHNSAVFTAAFTPTVMRTFSVHQGRSTYKRQLEGGRGTASGESLQGRGWFGTVAVWLARSHAYIASVALCRGRCHTLLCMSCIA
jgi:hypothetical protein